MISFEGDCPLAAKRRGPGVGSGACFPAGNPFSRSAQSGTALRGASASQAIGAQPRRLAGSTLPSPEASRGAARLRKEEGTFESSCEGMLPAGRISAEAGPFAGGS